MEQQNRKLDQIKENINRKLSSIRSAPDENTHPNEPLPAMARQETSAEQRLEQKRLKRAKYESIELKPLNTQRLKPLKVDNEKGFAKIRSDGWLVLFLSRQNKKLYISPDGLTLQMKTPSKHGVLEYRFERLPAKLRPWYRYAYEFVRVARSKTPRIIYANNCLKCTLMDNEPLNSIEVEFYQQRPEVKVYFQKGAETMDIVYKEL